MAFTIGDHDFLYDDQPYQVLSGALHYFRVHPDQWADRIHKARLMGLNTIETYVPWNLHAPARSEFRTDGPLDLGRFLDLISAEGMNAIVRPGPYICAEWTNGGLPMWLFADGRAGVRLDEPIYMAAIEDYYRHLAPILSSRQVDSGGPIILVQVENEYGAFGTDKDYLRQLVKLNRSIGITVPLTTVDQPTDEMLTNGTIPELLATGSFGGNVTERLRTLRRHQPTGPMMCSEFWDGWFDSWGGHHHRTSAGQAASDLDELLSAGASVNIYMFHGGTNFGFTNGANDKGVYQPIVTSYDYDAPLDESGNPTEKFWAFREVIARHAPVPDEIPTSAKPSPTFSVDADSMLPLWDALDVLGTWQYFDRLPTTEDVESYEGFTLYRTQVDGGLAPVFTVSEVRDRVQAFIDCQPVGVLSREHGDRTLPLPVGVSGILDLLVEDQGRVSYGPRIGESKGLIAPATLGGTEITHWAVLPLALRDIDPVSTRLDAQGMAERGAIAGPAFLRARFDILEISDLHLDLTGWGKGSVWLNGFNLGRYWARGPQHTMYVPAPLLRTRGNELIVFETRGTTTTTLNFVAQMDLGHEES